MSHTVEFLGTIPWMLEIWIFFSIIAVIFSPELLYIAKQLLNQMLSIHRIYQKDLKTFMFFMVFARFQ